MSLDLELARGFASRNYNPFIQIYGVPALDTARIAAPGESRLTFTLDIASHFGDGRAAGEILSMDGETYRGELRYQYGLRGAWEVGLAVPLVAHDGGIFDGFIKDWHDVFGLPSLGRDTVADDQLLFRYQRNGETRVEITESTSGIGDVLLLFGRELGASERGKGRTLALRGQLKLPTGDADKLLGSGGWDAALWLQSSGIWRERFAWHAAGGMTYLGTGDVLPELQRHLVASGTLGVVWQAFSPLALKLQLDAQSSAYENSELNELDATAFQFTIGGTARFSERWYFDFGVIENFPNGDTSPDVTLQMRLRTLL